MVAVLHVVVLTIVILVPVALVLLIVWGVKAHGARKSASKQVPEAVSVSEGAKPSDAVIVEKAEQAPRGSEQPTEAGKVDAWEDED